MKTEALNTHQTAIYLGGEGGPLSPRTIEAWRRTGGGPRYVRLGRGSRAPVRYRKADLDQWVEDQIRENTSQETAAK